MRVTYQGEVVELDMENSAVKVIFDNGEFLYTTMIDPDLDLNPVEVGHAVEDTTDSE